MPLDEALGTLGERLKSIDFQQVALIATLQRETGGNTAEVVELVADTIRERLELRAMVRALTRRAGSPAMILSWLPVACCSSCRAINPSYVHPLFHSTIGNHPARAGGVDDTGGLVRDQEDRSESTCEERLCCFSLLGAVAFGVAIAALFNVMTARRVRTSERLASISEYGFARERKRVPSVPQERPDSPLLAGSSALRRVRRQAASATPERRTSAAS